MTITLHDLLLHGTWRVASNIWTAHLSHPFVIKVIVCISYGRSAIAFFGGGFLGTGSSFCIFDSNSKILKLNKYDHHTNIHISADAPTMDV